MPKRIEIRNVAEELHRVLKARAASVGLSLSAYLRNELRLAAERPTLEEMRARLATRPPVNPATPPADVVRAMRGPIGG